MANTKNTDHECRICLTIGLIGAAVALGLIMLFLARTELAVLVRALILLAVAPVLFLLVDRYCRGRYGAEDKVTARAAVAPIPAPAPDPAPSPEKVPEPAPVPTAAPEPKEPAPAKTPEPAPADAAAEGTRPEALSAPRGGTADDLKLIKGIGPKLEQLCHTLGFYHFDQISAWTADEVAWVDQNLEGFKGRVTRDNWVEQAKVLAAGGTTEFAQRVEQGDVPSSQ